MKRCIWLRAVLPVVLVSMLALPLAARAALIGFITADESNVNDGALIYAGGATPLIGGPIDVDFIFGIDTPLNEGLENGIACVDCKLAFVTGNSLQIPGIYVFGGGGVLAMEGAVPAAGIDDSQALLLGEITGALVLDLSPDAVFLGGVLASFRDLKNTALTDYFGLPQGQVWNGIFAMGLLGLNDPTSGAFVAGVYGYEGQLAGALINLPVPEPSTWLLFLLGVAGVFFHRIHRGRGPHDPVMPQGMA